MRSVRLEGVTKVFRGREDVIAIDDVDLDVKAGELLVLLGPSGCGKTTLLRCIGGLEQPTRGRITIDGTVVFDAARGIDVPPNKRDFGLVFQTHALWPHLTVRQNVEYPLRARGKRAELKANRAEEVLDLVRCAPLVDRLPAELSGGQQQRVALARALAGNSELILFDEPLSNLDALIRTELRAQLRQIHSDLHYTGIYVTHDQTEALSLGDRVAVMHSGKVEQLTDPEELFNRPSTEYVANFVGVRNRIRLWRDGEIVRSSHGPVSLQIESTDELALYVRPEDVVVDAAGNTGSNESDAFCLSGTAQILDSLYFGREVEYVIKFGEETIFARVLKPPRRFERGDSVRVGFGAQDVLIYGGGRLVTSRSRMTQPRESAQQGMRGDSWPR